MKRELTLLEKLQDYAAKNPSQRGPKCVTCRLLSPAQLEFLTEARALGYQFPQIAATLAGEGVAIKASRLANHVREGHV